VVRACRGSRCHGGRKAEGIRWTGSASADLRQEAIAKAAYYKAERRGFAPGFEMQDWLDAEREAVSGEAGQ
jgi:hypothetical protein